MIERLLVEYEAGFRIGIGMRRKTSFGPRPGEAARIEAACDASPSRGHAHADPVTMKGEVCDGSFSSQSTRGQVP